MEIFTIHDFISVLLPTFFRTLGGLKYAFMAAIFSNVGTGFADIAQGDWMGVLVLVGSVILLWRLKSWIFGFVFHLISR